MANEGATLLPVNATPQEGEEGKSSRFSSSRITVGLGIVLLAGAGVAVATTHRSRTQASTANLATAGEGVGLDQIKKYEPGWYFYKAAFIAAKGDYKEAWKFIENFSGGYSCEAVNLGCNGYKLTCDYGNADTVSDKQLHYVYTPEIFSHAVDQDNLGADGWAGVMKKSLMSIEEEFSTQMHNKVELVVGDMKKKIEQLEGAGYKGLKRYEMNKPGERAKYGDAVVAHFMVNIVGQVWDFAGLLGSEAVAAELGFSPWEPNECAMAHSIGSDVAKLSHIMNEADTPLETFWTGQQVAVSEMEDADVKMMISHYRDNTGANIESLENEFCRVVKITYDNSEARLKGGANGNTVELKLVQSFEYQGLTGPSDDYQLQDYQNYVDRVHERYLSRPNDGKAADRWRGWDHFLDQHIGIKYAMDAGCEAEAQVVNKMLLDNHVPVGKRSVAEDGDHYYAGYKQIPMTMEFNTECHTGEGMTNICACVHANSDLLAMEKYDYSCLDTDDVY